MITKKYIALIFAASFAIVIPACDMEDPRPDYDPMTNNIPEGGELIEWHTEQGLLNIADIEKDLGIKNRETFSQSIGWYATESNVGFDRLSGKTARQAVDMINCLKTTVLKNQKKCLTPQ